MVCITESDNPAHLNPSLSGTKQEEGGPRWAASISPLPPVERAPQKSETIQGWSANTLVISAFHRAERRSEATWMMDKCTSLTRSTRRGLTPTDVGGTTKNGRHPEPRGEQWLGVACASWRACEGCRPLPAIHVQQSQRHHWVSCWHKPQWLHQGQRGNCGVL